MWMIRRFTLLLLRPLLTGSTSATGGWRWIEWSWMPTTSPMQLTLGSSSSNSPSLNHISYSVRFTGHIAHLDTHHLVLYFVFGINFKIILKLYFHMCSFFSFFLIFLFLFTTVLCILHFNYGLLSEINMDGRMDKIHFVSLTSPVSIHLIIHLSSRLCYRHHSQLLPLTYKVIHSLICLQPHRSTHSSSDVVTPSRPPTISSSKITDCSFWYASSRLWNQLPDLFRQPSQSVSFLLHVKYRQARF